MGSTEPRKDNGGHSPATLKLTLASLCQEMSGVSSKYNPTPYHSRFEPWGTTELSFQAGHLSSFHQGPQNKKTSRSFQLVL